MTTELDSFETDLLNQLRALVAARAAEPTPAPRRSRRRWLLAPIGAAAAALTALGWLAGIGSEPAYAVTVDGTGEVHVRVHRLDDASGLRKALQAQGITADVQYLAADTECAPGRYVDAAPRPGTFSFTAGAGYGYSIDLARGVVHRNETLVIEASRTSPTGDPDGDGVADQGGSWVSVGVASGAVTPCVPVPRQ